MYLGDVRASDVDNAIKTMKNINPNAKRLYLRMEGKKLQFVGRTRDASNAIKEHVVREIAVNDSDIGDAELDTVNGFPVCLSIPAFENAIRGRDIDNEAIRGYRNRRTEIEEMMGYGHCIACPVGDDR